MNGYTILMIYVYITEGIRRNWPWAAVFLLGYVVGMCTRIVVVGE